jgi:hypothetical protein
MSGNEKNTDPGLSPSDYREPNGSDGLLLKYRGGLTSRRAGVQAFAFHAVDA